MTNTRLDDALNHYSKTLNLLEEAIGTKTANQRSEKSASNPLEEKILAVLLARSAVDLVINETSDPNKERLITLVELDKRLKQHSIIIHQCGSLPDWRTSLKPSAEAWWWFPESTKHEWDRRDWLWSFLTLLVLAAAFSLIANIAPRFLSGNPSIQGAFAVIAQSFIALLTAGSLLTNAGQKSIERALERLNIPNHFRAEAKFGLAILLLLGLLWFYSTLPWFAAEVNLAGVAD